MPRGWSTWFQLAYPELGGSPHAPGETYGLVLLLDDRAVQLRASNGRSHRLDETGRLDGQFLGSGCNAGPVGGTTSATPHKRGDDALGPVGPPGPAGGRHRL